MALQTDAPPEASPPSIWEALRYPAFRLMVAGSVASSMAQQMQGVASGYLVYEMTGSTVQLGLMGIFRALPVLMFSLVGGAIADSLDRRTVMILSQGIAAIASAILAILSWMGMLEVWHLYAATFIVGITGTVFQPTRMAMVPQLVPPRALMNAISFNTAAQQSSGLIAPAIAGVVLAMSGGTWNFGLCAAGLGISVLMSTGLPSSKPAPGAVKTSQTEHFMGGLKFVRAEPMILSILAMDYVINILAGFRVLLPVFAKDVLHVGPEGLGILSAAPGIGALLGSFSVIALSNVRRRGAIIMTVNMLYAIGIIAFGGSTLFIVSAGLLVLLSYVDSIGMTTRNTMVLAFTPNALRGRVQSVIQLISASGPSLSGIQAGTTAALLGAGPALMLGGAISIVVILIAHWRVPALWSYREKVID